MYVHAGFTDYYVLIFSAEHGSPLCGGDGLFLKDHDELSQRLVRVASLKIYRRQLQEWRIIKI